MDEIKHLLGTKVYLPMDELVYEHSFSENFILKSLIPAFKDASSKR